MIKMSQSQPDLLLEQNMRCMTGFVSCLENRITKLTACLSRIEQKMDLFTEGLNRPLYENHSVNSAADVNIIPFPESFFAGSAKYEPENPRAPHISSPLQAMPGLELSPEIPDYRPFLQRDGLILLAWDRRVTETGERFTAYWVTSAGVPRFYASKQCAAADFCFARPDHKSYAAEDGIEFYGQEAPSYIVHVAPELMMSNPRHGELRPAHISILKHQGSEVDFDYKYLLTLEKNRMPPGKPRKDHSHRVGA
jgi:hypothetical protein